MIMMLSRVEFEQLVAQALDELPDFIQQEMTNVEVLIEPWPNRRQMLGTELPQGYTLLGLYHGVPLTERSSFYALVPPDTITLYQGPIEQAAGSQERVIAVVRRTVVHEVAHHFGISDDRLRELGAY
jgi:predicted Zn-dependent protease with MMP-like domain